MSTTAVRINPASGRPQGHAVKIAEQATEAWYDAHGGGDLAIPMSVVAALSQTTPPPHQRTNVAAAFARLSLDEFTSTIRKVWTAFVRSRPDLANPVYPLIEPWFDKDRPITPEKLRAAKRVADRVLRADLHALTDTESRRDVDLLGLVLTVLRPKASLQGRGQYYTSTDIADVLTDITLSDALTVTADLSAPELPRGASIHDPACGTGGLIRATAAALRRRGADPAEFQWYGNDIDALAIAGFAVNAVLWGLGPMVVLGVADSLNEPDWASRALRMRQETLDIARDARALAALRNLEKRLAPAETDAVPPPGPTT